jgi:hypothetical protein
MMGKKKVSAPIDIRGAVSGFLKASTEAARSEYGDANMCVMGEAGRIVVGLPLPSLCLEYFFQNDAFPLSRMIQVVGTEGTCKSALCFEMARWFKESNGITYLFENETKYSPDFAQSIIGYSDADNGYESLAHYPCDSLEDWQSKIQYTVGQVREMMVKKTAANPTPIGRVFPVLLVLDSITGKLSRESAQTIEKQGFAGRSHPVEALKINSFLKKFPQDIEEWPVSFVAVNHLKPQKTATGAIENNKAGGRSISFQETFEIEMKRARVSKVNLVDPDEDGFEIGGNNLRMICRKNSLGETHRELYVSVLWKNKRCPETGQMRQYTRWDWPGGTVDLLTKFESGKRRDMIKEVVDLHKVTGGRWWSNRLGVTKDNPISKSEIGMLIDSNEAIRDSLRDLFGIKRRKKFEVGVDYLAQLDKLKEEVTASVIGGE